MVEKHSLQMNNTKEHTQQSRTVSPLQREPKVLWHIHRGDGPVLGIAVHAGHEMRPELLPSLAIDEVARVREEDPYTDYWTGACDNQIITRRSRFEVDLNRSREMSICVHPEDCWNLEVWSASISPEAQRRSFEEHDAFYDMFTGVLRDLEREYRHFVVLDIHSYNHRRSGPLGPAEDPNRNPEINLGTATVNAERWRGVIERFKTDLEAFDFLGRHLDVRENINFKGGYLPQFVNSTFPETGLAIAIEIKKFFMDEWTGVGSPLEINALLDAFRSTIPGLTETLEAI